MATPQDMIRLYRYNQWAWREVWPSLLKLTSQQAKQKRPFFWATIHGLAVHAVCAEWVWSSRLQGISPKAMWDPADFAELEHVYERWQKENERLQAYVVKLTEDDLNQTLHYQNTSGQAFSAAISDILRHVVNHATEHRSQLTPELFRLGVPTRPLDYIGYSLTHPPQSLNRNDL